VYIVLEFVNIRSSRYNLISVRSGFALFHQAGLGMLPRSRRRAFPATFLPIHYLLPISSLDVACSLMRPSINQADGHWSDCGRWNWRNVGYSWYTELQRQCVWVRRPFNGIPTLAANWVMLLMQERVCCVTTTDSACIPLRYNEGSLFFHLSDCPETV
jgi:hypothetical protein